jgi:Na+-translocating ferredoxin:NAD+ oxidoreductase RnfD subunit
MIIGSFFILTSQGQPERVKRGKEIFVGAIAGLFVMIAASFLMQLIGVDILGLFKPK